MEEESWVAKYWRPMMAYAYIIVILFDFVIAPVLWSVGQAILTGSILVPWVPLTLGGGGLFHGAMCAVLGVSSFTRGQAQIEAIKGDVAKTVATTTTSDNKKIL